MRHAFDCCELHAVIGIVVQSGNVRHDEISRSHQVRVEIIKRQWLIIERIDDGSAVVVLRDSGVICRECSKVCGSEQILLLAEVVRCAEPQILPDLLFVAGADRVGVGSA